MSHHVADDAEGAVMDTGGGGAASVVVYLYDLSMGMARQFSGQFLGKQIDGIWLKPQLLKK